jgi:hypothetical protein
MDGAMTTRSILRCAVLLTLLTGCDSSHDDEPRVDRSTGPSLPICDSSGAPHPASIC